jgi:hypothetical protein
MANAASPTSAAEAELDDALDDTFPASDPPSQTDPTHGVKSAATTPDEDAIRLRAYDIWEKARSQAGSHEEHWSQAKRELEGGS